MRAHLALYPLAACMVLLACNASPESPLPEPAASVQAPAATPEVMDECPGESAGHDCSAAPPADAASTHFGRAFQLTKNEPLSAAAARIGDAEETVQVSGTVEAVCKKKGCWMELRDGDTSAKVFTYAGEFFLPVSTAKGRKAVVEGKLKVKTITQKFAQHLAEDQGEDASAVTGPQQKIVIEAESISLL